MKPSSAIFLILSVVLTTFPAQGISVGPEVPLSSTALEAAAGDQQFGLQRFDQCGGVLSNGEDFLFAWTSGTSGLRDWSYGASSFAMADEDSGDVYIARISRTGVRESAVPIPIADSPAYETLESATTNGHDYALLVSCEGQLLLSFVRGDVVEPPVPVGTKSPSYPAAIASDGLRYLMVWGTGVDTRAVFVDEAGRRVSEEFVVDAGGNPQQIAIANNGNGFLVAVGGYTSGHYLRTFPISRDGVVSEPQPIGKRDSMMYSGIVFNGRWYSLLVSEVESGVGVTNIYTLSPEGIPIRPPLPVSSTAWVPRIVGGAGLLLLSSRDNVIFAQRVTENGEYIDAAPVPILEGVSRDPYGLLFAVGAWNGSEYFVTWTDERGGDPFLGSGTDTYGSVVDASLRNGSIDGTPDGELLTFSGAPQSFPAISMTSGLPLIAWQQLDTQQQTSQIHIAHLGTNDDVVIAPSHLPQTSPAVAAGGSNALVVWSEGQFREGNGKSRIRGAIVADGVALSSFDVSEAELMDSRPAVVWNGSEFLVVWQRLLYGPSGQIFARRVSPTGTLLDDHDVLLTTDQSTGHYMPAIAWNGASYLLVYAQGEPRGRYGRHLDIHAVTVTTLLQTSSEIVVAATERDEENPSIAWSGSSYLIAFAVSRILGQPDVFVSVVESDGTAAEVKALAADEEAYEMYPRVAFDGAAFVVVWTTRRPLNRPQSASAVKAARVSQQGELLETVDVTTPETISGHPAIDAAGGRAIVAYVRPAPERGTAGATTLFTRKLTSSRLRPIR